jgi:glycosyltransferase involved in cell wall biosynthesis
VGQQLQVGFFTEIYHPAVNGVVASVDALAGGLRELGHDVFCFAPSMPGDEQGVGPVLRMPSLPLPTHSPYRLTLPLMSRRNVRRFVRPLSVIHAHSLFVTGWMGLRFARRYGIPIVYTYHTQLEAYAHYVPFDANATRFAASQLTRTFGNLVDAVVVPTPAMATRLRELGVSERVEVVPSAIDVEHFAAGRRDDALRARLGVGEGQRLLLVVSRIAPEKNIDIALRAFARAGDPDLILAVGGDGPALDEMRSLAAALGIGGRTRFLGAVERTDLPDLYASADAFVFPSTTETQGLVQIEAMAAGCLVIAADTPQNREVVGAEGVLVPADPDAFAGALATFQTPAAQQRANARLAAGRFSIHAQAERMVEVYRSLRPAAAISTPA